MQFQDDYPGGGSEAAALLRRFEELAFRDDEADVGVGRSYVSTNPVTRQVFAEQDTPEGVVIAMADRDDDDESSGADCVTYCDADLRTGILDCVSVCPSRPRILDAHIRGRGPIVLDVDEMHGETNLNGRPYATAELIEYLYAEGGPKVVPHTGQVLSPAQADNVIRLIGEGQPYLMASATSDVVYALDEPVSPEEAISSAVLTDELDQETLMEADVINRHQYLVDAFLAYAVEIGMLIGMRYKTAINFGIARHMNISGTDDDGHPIMGEDIDIIAVMLEAEADGLRRCPENECSMRQRIQAFFPISEGRARRFSVPWANGICCVLSESELALVDSQGFCALQSLQCSVNSGWECAQRRPIAAYLSDIEFAERLSMVDDGTLEAIALTIPIEGPNSDGCCPCQPYVIRESNLSVGAPLSPPMLHSVGQKALRLARTGGLRPQPCDRLAKASCITFLRDSPCSTGPA